MVKPLQLACPTSVIGCSGQSWISAHDDLSATDPKPTGAAEQRHASKTPAVVVSDILWHRPNVDVS
jgi:hypothetical protein